MLFNNALPDMALTADEAAAILGVNSTYPKKYGSQGDLLCRVISNPFSGRDFFVFSLSDCLNNRFRYVNTPTTRRPRAEKHKHKGRELIKQITKSGDPQILFGDAISVWEAANILGVTRSFVPRMCESGLIAGRRAFGRDLRQSARRSLWIISRMSCVINRQDYLRKRQCGQAIVGRKRKRLDALIEVKGEAPSKEGRILLHRSRERSARLRRAKCKSVLAACGSLRCEACGFDFMDFYGDRGSGFAECHHRDPLANLTHGGERCSTIEDLAILCANCHRMIHKNPWLSVEELHAELVARRSARAKMQ
jgi:hypothetical protein